MAIAEAWELAVTKASSNLSENVIVTPVIRSETIAARLRRNLRTNSLVSPKIDLLFKCENLQRTGSFKLRGATHFISQLSDSQLRSGLVAYSTGAH